MQAAGSLATLHERNRLESNEREKRGITSKIEYMYAHEAGIPIFEKNQINLSAV